MLRPLLMFAITFTVGTTALAAEKTAQETEYRTEKDILYLEETAKLTAYQRERCRLDVYHPLDRTGFATVVWFHGGGLSGGNRHIPAGLENQGIAVVAANYRLHPKVTCPAYLEDAAAAVAWTFRNIEKYGGDAGEIFVSGHSAGGYRVHVRGCRL